MKDYTGSVRSKMCKILIYKSEKKMIFYHLCFQIIMPGTLWHDTSIRILPWCVAYEWLLGEKVLWLSSLKINHWCWQFFLYSSGWEVHAWLVNQRMNLCKTPFFSEKDIIHDCSELCLHILLNVLQINERKLCSSNF